MKFGVVQSGRHEKTDARARQRPYGVRREFRLSQMCGIQIHQIASQEIPTQSALSITKPSTFLHLRQYQLQKRTEYHMRQREYSQVVASEYHDVACVKCRCQSLTGRCWLGSGWCSWYYISVCAGKVHCLPKESSLRCMLFVVGALSEEAW